MPILIILGWIIVLGCFFYLSADAAQKPVARMTSEKGRTARRRFKSSKKHHHYDEKRRKWVRKMRLVQFYQMQAMIFQRNVMPLRISRCSLYGKYIGLWKLRRRHARSQIPYLFLLVMMIGLPFAIRVLSWRSIRTILRRTA